MEYILKNLEPAKVLHFFEELSSIPRASYNEDKAIHYIINFAKERGLWVYCDNHKNIYIKKEASNGKENSFPILFQGHIDMVCEKDSASTHDFTKDGLKLQVDGDILSAKGTTLGADNGVAIAIMLALLDDNTIAHPPIECLMTVEEEVGLIGAQYVEADKIDARTMINLDTSEYGCVLVSCSGGRESTISKQFTPVYNEQTALEIKISGLRGGHSGININEGRANANKIMAELLMDLVLSQHVNISSIKGGEKSNAIPREAACTLLVENISKTKEIIKQFTLKTCEEYALVEKDLAITANEVIIDNYLSEEHSLQMIKMLMSTPNGVVTMSKDLEGLVETSLNLGALNVCLGSMETSFSLRSCIESEMQNLVDLLAATANNYGATINHSGIYPGWELQKYSPIRDVFVNAYKSFTGKEMKVAAVHCGLECGIIKKMIPDMDIIACGPNIYDYHCPSERMEISSLAKLWELLKVVLGSL